MLILMRRLGEKVMIGEHIQMVVLGIKDNQVSLGIDAPRELAIHRFEVYERMVRKNQKKLHEQKTGILKRLLKKPDLKMSEKT